MDLISPFLNLTNTKSFTDTNQEIYMNGGALGDDGGSTSNVSGSVNRMMMSGRGTTKRSVSETKKKFVAANQNWLCGDCKRQLPAWFEVDHVIALHNGGSNEVSNLVALCRDCHGKKTAMDHIR
jgi:CO dehydrogenase/acetyl-CoA synthase alpha subunit